MSFIQGNITSVKVVPLDAAGTPTGPPVELRDATLNVNPFQFFDEAVVGFKKALITFSSSITLTMQATFGLLDSAIRRIAIEDFGIPESDIRKVDGFKGIVYLYNWRKVRVW